MMTPFHNRIMRLLNVVIGLSSMGGIAASASAGTWTVLTLPQQQPGQVRRPQGVAADRYGNFYVADTDNQRVQKRDPQGQWSVLTTVGNGPGQMITPSSLAVDGAGNLIIADSSTSTSFLKWV
jgi:DNA-binding beta-propeller fold protein YncE